MLTKSAASIAGAGLKVRGAEASELSPRHALPRMLGIRAMSMLAPLSADLNNCGAMILRSRHYGRSKRLTNLSTRNGSFGTLASKDYGISHAAKALADRSCAATAARIDPFASSERKPA